MLCLMFEADQRGVLRSLGSPWTKQKIIRTVQGASDKRIAELVANGVCRISRKDGAIYSKRLIRDELKRRHKAQSGSKGGKQTGSKPEARPQANRGSSVSSSPSPSPTDTQQHGGADLNLKGTEAILFTQENK